MIEAKVPLAFLEQTTDGRWWLLGQKAAWRQLLATVSRNPMPLSELPTVTIVVT